VKLLDDDVLDAIQAAELLKVSRGTVLKLAQGGKIPAQKVGRQWRFSKEALIEWLKSGQAQEK